MAAVHYQPFSEGVPVKSFPNGVEVRTMKVEDSEFAGRILVEGFESKFIHAVGKRNLDKVMEASSIDHRSMGSIYHRIFIATVDGQPAGLMELKFHGDKSHGGSSEPYSQRLGCWVMCRLGIMLDSMTESVGQGRCYVDHIAVDARFRGKGLGKALLETADEVALRNNCNVIYLWVYDGNRAKHLYERQGYVTVDTGGGCIVKCLFGMEPFAKMEKNLQNF
ncbi:uncharacterized protein LOC101855882 [Aplysia californica]|uniref:Uncharacterized protein LOC101855882 n=1 Tax=Aplysia californica TaxID=6500 RepID=A0ABM0JVG6_APLCA|nr:uncharacterized protein LOC101855882 [Aplysia californica]